MKRLLGWLAICLGTAGLGVMIALGIIVWKVTPPLTETSGVAIRQTDRSLQIARRRVRQSAASVQEARHAVARSQQQLVDWQQAGAKLNRRSLLQLQQLRQELRLATQQADTWLQVMASAGEFLEQLLRLTRAAGLDLQQPQERLTELLQEIRAAEESVRNTSSWLHDFTERLSQNGFGDDFPARVAEATPLMTDIIERLDRVSSSMRRFDESLDGTQDQLGAMEVKTALWLPRARGVVLSICGCLALGQISLLSYGWKMLVATAY